METVQALPQGVDLKKIAGQSRDCMRELLNAAQLRPGEIVVVGCSTSEVIARRIGSHSSSEVAVAMLGELLQPCRRRELFLAVQCCEHLNRALVVERACAERYALEQVNVRPALKAGGALSVQAYEQFDDPVVVEAIRAHAGLDIGNTLIGMHLRAVVVPVRIQDAFVGAAPVVMARTRSKYIGGPRAVYDDMLAH